ncbi:hypothetical protein GCM10023107_96040 [Actinoplanes octamycinicus]|nr:hypothetical protein Aoc01nite_21350 [Actinoplanes octamycinicus]
MNPPVAALAALHAAAPVEVPFPAQAADRLIGVVGAPCADTGPAGTTAATTATAAVATRKERTADSQADHTTGTFPVTREIRRSGTARSATARL